MWNQNGNGQGYGQQNAQGYGQQGGYQEDVYGRLNHTRDVGGARFPYIDAGNHKLALVTLDEFGSPNEPKARALFKVLESRTMQVGSFCVKIWSILKPPRFPNGTTEGDEFADFMIKLKDAKHGYPIGNDIRMLLKERPAEQLARGSVIDCVGIPPKKAGSTYVKVYWTAVQQGPQDIAAMRQRLEAEGIPNTGAQQNQAPQQGYGQQPMMPQQPQYAPQQPPQQPQYAPQQAPQQPPQQPQYAPQQPPAPPAGGFLANVPPQGGNGGGGGRPW